MSHSICKIKVRKSIIGTGFFIAIPIPNKEKPLRGLMTNNHILNESQLESNKSFNIYMAYNEEQGIEIEINDEDFIFTSELIDITFIELNNEIIDEIEPTFLKPSNQEAEMNEAVLICQYANKEYSLAFGNISNINSINYYHKVDTNKGSSGSPLLNKNYEVVGIHKVKECIDESFKHNIAVKYSEVEFAIKILLNNINIYGLEKAKKSAKLLLLYETEMRTLKKYGLKLKLSSENMNKPKNKIDLNQNNLNILSKTLFYCTFSKNLLFYRTNYAWYVTILSKENRISEYNLDELKQLDWSPIISNNEAIDEKIEKKINGREYALITWLKLTELIFVRVGIKEEINKFGIFKAD
ncbi:trypsin-like cysteine/serine peptidase domain-containing protein [Neocallimastix sp. 'constans']